MSTDTVSNNSSNIRAMGALFAAGGAILVSHQLSYQYGTIASAVTVGIVSLACFAILAYYFLTRESSPKEITFSAVPLNERVEEELESDDDMPPLVPLPPRPISPASPPRPAPLVVLDETANIAPIAPHTIEAVAPSPARAAEPLPAQIPNANTQTKTIDQKDPESTLNTDTQTETIDQKAPESTPNADTQTETIDQKKKGFVTNHPYWTCAMVIGSVAALALDSYSSADIIIEVAGSVLPDIASWSLSLLRPVVLGI